MGYVELYVFPKIQSERESLNETEMQWLSAKMVCTGKGIEAQQMWVTPVSFPRINHLKHIHTESSRDEIGKSTLDWGSYWLIIFPSDSLSGWEVQSPKEDAAFSIWEVAVLLGTDCLLCSMSM